VSDVCSVWWMRSGGRIVFGEQGEGELYGNNVHERPAYLPSSANRSWIDIDNSLPDGHIERFYIYVHSVPNVLDPQSRRIRLQVWRRVDVTLRIYRLVWSQLIQITADHSVGALYSVCMIDCMTSWVVLCITWGWIPCVVPSSSVGDGAFAEKVYIRLNLDEISAKDSVVQIVPAKSVSIKTSNIFRVCFLLITNSSNMDIRTPMLLFAYTLSVPLPTTVSYHPRCPHTQETIETIQAVSLYL